MQWQVIAVPADWVGGEDNWVFGCKIEAPSAFDAARLASPIVVSDVLSTTQLESTVRFFIIPYEDLTIIDHRFPDEGEFSVVSQSHRLQKKPKAKKPK